jgi:hypothetical protein
MWGDVGIVDISNRMCMPLSLIPLSTTSVLCRCYVTGSQRAELLYPDVLRHCCCAQKKVLWRCINESNGTLLVICEIKLSKR